MDGAQADRVIAIAPIPHPRSGSPHPPDGDAPAPPDGPRGGGTRPAEYRYGVVFLLLLGLLLFAIVAPAASWSRAVALALESAALVVAVATARAGRVVRRRRAGAAAACALIAIAGVATGLVPSSVTPALSGLIAVAIPAALVGGLARLIRERGVTLQAVAGTLAIYLLVGLLFAWVVELATRLGAAPYFANGTNGTSSERVYYSFTVLTTTGFGDLTAGTPTGRALAVLEMLVGQLYLVTILGLVVSNFRGGWRSESAG